MKNTFARARGLQILKDIKDPEGEKKKREIKESVILLILKKYMDLYEII